jgi:hypothetical protein
MAAHQTRTIDDVRTLAPDTPPLLAEMIRQMTSPTPNQRPRGFDEVLQRWGRAGSFGRSRLKRFRQLFDTAVPHFARPIASSGQSHWVWLTALAIFCSAGVAMFYDNGLRGELLEIVQNIQSAAQSSRNPSNGAETTSQNPGASQESRLNKNLRPLPKPSADGVVTLTERGPYAAGTISFPGNLTIRGLNGAGSEIVVENDPLMLTAQRVHLDHVALRSAKLGHSAFLSKIHCQQLQITNCE